MRRVRRPILPPPRTWLHVAIQNTPAENDCQELHIFTDQSGSLQHFESHMVTLVSLSLTKNSLIQQLKVAATEPQEVERKAENID